MAIDFGNPKEYLSSKLDDLLDGISESYGTLLMEELISRLESTITDFNNEMTSVFEYLKEKESNRQSMLRKIKSGESVEVDGSEKTQKPAWKEKIDNIEKKKKK